MNIPFLGQFSVGELKREFVAGLTTFLTMSYIVVVNPGILSTQGTGMAFSGVMTATVLLCVICTFLMGFYAKLPYAVAPGMGINAFFTYSLVLQQKIPWPTALGMVIWSGVIFFILSVTPVRTAILKAMPQSIRHAAAVGIGLFLTFIGLKNAGIIVSHPATFVTFGPITLTVGFALLGLVLIAVLVQRKNPTAFLLSIFAVTLLGLIFGKVTAPAEILSSPDFSSVFFKADLMGALKLSLLPAIVSIMFTDLFDSISTFVGLSQAAGLTDRDGEPLRVREGLIVDAWATALAGVFGTSSGTAYIESAAGIEAGGRTGLSSVFTALLFLPCFFVGPLVEMVPAFATAPVLIVVGFLMFGHVKQLKFESIADSLPAFLTIVLIPLTFSITQGLLWGLVSHVCLYLLMGRARDVSKGLWGVFFLCLFLIYLQSN